MRDSTLYSLMTAFTKAALRETNRTLAGNPMPVSSEEVPQITGNQIRMLRVRTPDPTWVLVDSRNAIKTLPELAAVFSHVRSLSGVSLRDSVQEEWAADAVDRFYGSFVNRFLLLYLKKREQVSFHKATFDAIYKAWEDCLFRDDVTLAFLAPIYNLYGDVQLLAFEAPRCTLRRTTPEDLARIWRHSVVDQIDLFRINYVLESVESVKKEDTITLPPVEVAFARTITSLRLVKAGGVDIAPILHDPAHEVFGLSLSGSHSPLRHPLLGDWYLLEEKDGALAREIYANLSNQAIAHLAVAVDRFNFAYERGRVEDKLIDYWIALETLFLPNERQELRYRASLRAAYFLGEGADDRKRIFQRVRESYDMRSAIVHGTRPEGNVSQVAEFTEDVLRQALRRAVESPETLNIEKLDNAIVKGSGSQEDL